MSIHPMIVLALDLGGALTVEWLSTGYRAQMSWVAQLDEVATAPSYAAAMDQLNSNLQKRFGV